MLVLAAAMLLLVAVSGVGMLVDPRQLLGVSVWLKPFKFGVSMAIFATTMAWLLSLPMRARRLLWWLGTATAAVLLVDVGIVAYYGAQGTLSHFNTSSAPLDVRLSIFLGISISAMFVVDVVMALVLVFQRAGDRALSAAIRGGFALTVAGMGLAYLMVFDNPKRQVITDASGRVMRMPAGHAVGVPDGGPGLPLLGWSTTGGDLRIPHFVGIHGLQVMLGLAVLLSVLARRIPVLADERLRARLVGVGVAGYAGLTALVTWQALRGQPLTAPDAATLGALALLVAAVAGAVLLTVRRYRTGVRSPASMATASTLPAGGSGHVA